MNRYLTGFFVAFCCVVRTLADEVGDPIAGEKVFLQCIGCHSSQAEHRATGPNLHSLIGRQAGSLDGFQYSSALTNSGIFWDERTLDEFLANPSLRVPDTMMFIGVSNAQDRADLIQYLSTLGDATTR